MIPFTSGHRYFLYTGITDMRKGYNGLYGIIKNILESNPLDGTVYMFMNKRRNILRMMVYDTGGIVILSKRLERGTFEVVKSSDKSIKLHINWTQLTCIMQGIKLRSLKYRKRHKLIEEKV
jgi:transposase